MTMQPSASGIPVPERKHRYGLLKATIATSHAVRCVREPIPLSDMEKQALDLLPEAERPIEKKRLGGRFRPRLYSGNARRGGEVMQFTVRDMRAEHADAKRFCYCLTCGEAHKDERAMRMAHPSQAIMERQQEAHVWCWWSDDPITEAVANPISPTLPPTVVDTVVGLLSDE